MYKIGFCGMSHLGLCYSTAAAEKGFQITCFDFDDKKLISNFPAMLQYQDIVEEKRSAEDHYEVFERIYLDTDAVSTSIFREWVRRLNSITIKQNYSAYLQLTDVVLDPELKAQIIAQIHGVLNPDEGTSYWQKNGGSICQR